MPKRHHPHDVPPDAPPTKRMRPDKPASRDLLSGLSDELVLHILSFLPTQTLSLCQRLSHRLYGLAGDSELWKQKYYSRWVWPRARRIRHLKASGLATAKSPSSSSRSARWLGHEHLIENQENTDWKRQYRLRHNWSKGSCRVTELEVAQPSIPPVLVRLCKGVVFTADASNGLRAWTTKDTKSCLAYLSFSDESGAIKSNSTPTSIAVAAQGDSDCDFEVTVGFETGGYTIYSLNSEDGHFISRFTHPPLSNGAIIALASASSYLLTLSQNQTLSLYHFSSEINHTRQGIDKSAKLIASLKSNNIFAPVSLSIRPSSTDIIASIAYSFSRIGCGWSVGLQELRMDQDGESLGSRLATTVDLQFNGSAFDSLARVNGKPRQRSTISGPIDRPFISMPLSPSLSYTQPPTSLSYCHPYLLTSHADNTLTMYLVVSTSDSLGIKIGRRLWGHTSSVSGVQVSDRGKAVSVSSRGEEIRIWELEDMISSSSASRKAALRDSSVQVSPENVGRRRSLDLGLVSEAIERRGDGLGLALEDMSDELALMRGWVGFDDEQVVVLRERELGTQLLGCYDFT
ncbi:hypothetical protein FQN50_007883 [Emmonsiellopsis sp. PD_5]|nr:hypothetical protein FQN50_007883 [Emmonsiellopsis sp. PD_5]